MKFAGLLGRTISLLSLLLAFGCAQRPQGYGGPPDTPAQDANATPPPPGNPAYGATPGPAEPSPLQQSAPPQPPPAAPADTDHVVAGAVHRLLNQDTFLAPGAKNVTAKVNKGVVTLRGTVPSAHDRDMLAQRISQLPGVDKVDNQLQLEGPY
jgi:hypothetical protein